MFTLNKNSKIVISLMFTVCLAGVLATLLLAATPNLINYQGYLKYEDSSITGNRFFEFRIYDAESGGNLKWTSGSTQCYISNGLFRHILGSTTGGITGVNWEADTNYLEIWVGEASADTKLIPRERLISVPYALNTDKVDGQDYSTSWPTNSTTVGAAGAVMDSDFGSEGLMKRGATAGSYSIVTDNSGNWDTAYTDRMKWDGGSTGLNAATGRASLGLVIGTDVQAHDADLDDLADGTLTATKVQYGSYFITSAGSSGQVWKSDGSGAGVWGTDNNTQLSEATVESYVTNGIGTITMNNSAQLKTDEVRARDSGGLYLRDDSGTLGIFVKDGGNVGIGTTDPGSYKLNVNGPIYGLDTGNKVYAVYAP